MRGKLSASTANCVSASSMIQTPKKHILQDADIGYLIRLVKQVDLCFVENLSFYTNFTVFWTFYKHCLFIFFFFRKKFSLIWWLMLNLVAVAVSAKCKKTSFVDSGNKNNTGNGKSTNSFPDFFIFYLVLDKFRIKQCSLFWPNLVCLFISGTQG